ncbi:MAG: N-acetyltransferase family protein [Gaiellaceae bacterium]
MGASGPLPLALRPADPGAEAEAIAELHRRSAVAAYAALFRSPFPLAESVERWRSFEGTIHVAEMSGQLIGFIAQQEEQLVALYVHPEQWGAGVGSALLALAPATRRLWVLEANGAARDFYERRGWRPDGVSAPGPEGLPELRYRREPPDPAKGEHSLERVDDPRLK